MFLGIEEERADLNMNTMIIESFEGYCQEVVIPALKEDAAKDHGDRFLNEFVEFTSNNLSP